MPSSAIFMQGHLKTSDAKPADRRNTAAQARRKQHISDAAPCSGLSANRKQFVYFPIGPSERIANDSQGSHLYPSQIMSRRAAHFATDWR
jgi:hypothetical protein